MRWNCIDLFAGCGGLSLGLHAAGFDCVFAIEAHEHAFHTYRKNLLETGLAGTDWPDWLEVGTVDIIGFAENHADNLKSLRGKVDLIAGGPPCQGFTMNGRRNPDDPRSLMVQNYMEIVDLVRPTLVLLENVRGFVSMPHEGGGTYAEAVRQQFKAIGYDVWDDILLAAEWGVPQRRPRYICIAAQNDRLLGIDPFERLRTGRRAFLSRRGLWPGPTTVGDALSDLALNGCTAEPDPEWGHKGFKAVHRQSETPITPYQQLMRAGAENQPSDRRIARHRPDTVDRLREILATCRPGICLGPKDRERLGLGKRSRTPLDPAAAISHRHDPT